MRGTQVAAGACCTALFAALVSLGCGGHSDPTGNPPLGQPGGPATSDTLTAGLPPLGDLRGASVVHDHVCNGCDTLERSDNAVDDGTALKLNAGPDELSWGIWGWDASGDDLLSLSYDFDIPAGQQVYVAIADYLAQRWDVYGPLTDDEQFALDDTRHKSPTGMVYCAALAYDGNTPSVLTLTLSVDGNLAPVADLTADVTAGDPAFDVHFDASASSDPDGSITGYEWDCDGDGVFSEAGQEADALGSPMAVYTYSQADIYHACVRVTDDAGGTDTATLDIKARGWKIVILAHSEYYSYCTWNTSLAFVDGCPAVSYAGGDDNGSDPGKYGTFYSISGTAYGASATDWQTVQLDSQESITSLTVIDDRPAIACELGEELVYLHSATARGELLANWQRIAVDSFGEHIRRPSIALVDGRPAIAYICDPGWPENYLLRYASSSTPQGDSTTDWHYITLPTEREPYWPSLALIDGKPAIAWSLSQYETIGGLNYYYSSTPDGGDVSDWQNILIEPGPEHTGSGCCLKAIAGLPAISYYYDSGLNEGLRYAVSSTPQGGSAADWTKLMVIDDGSPHGITSLADLGGVPGISSWDGWDGDLDGLSCGISASPTGSDPADWAWSDVAPGLWTGEISSLALINGCPAIAYTSHGSDDICGELCYAILLQ